MMTGNARIAGMEEDLELEGFDYNVNPVRVLHILYHLRGMYPLVSAGGSGN